jgi:hypothetical protein
MVWGSRAPTAPSAEKKEGGFPPSSANRTSGCRCPNRSDRPADEIGPVGPIFVVYYHPQKTDAQRNPDDRENAR